MLAGSSGGARSVTAVPAAGRAGVPSGSPASDAAAAGRAAAAAALSPAVKAAAAGRAAAAAAAAPVAASPGQDQGDLLPPVSREVIWLSDTPPSELLISDSEASSQDPDPPDPDDGYMLEQAKALGTFLQKAAARREAAAQSLGRLQVAAAQRSDPLQAAAAGPAASPPPPTAQPKHQRELPRSLFSLPSHNRRLPTSLAGPASPRRALLPLSGPPSGHLPASPLGQLGVPAGPIRQLAAGATPGSSRGRGRKAEARAGEDETQAPSPAQIPFQKTEVAGGSQGPRLTVADTAIDLVSPQKEGASSVEERGQEALPVPTASPLPGKGKGQEALPVPTAPSQSLLGLLSSTVRDMRGGKRVHAHAGTMLPPAAAELEEVGDVPQLAAAAQPLGSTGTGTADHPGAPAGEGGSKQGQQSGPGEGGGSQDERRSTRSKRPADVDADPELAQRKKAQAAAPAPAAKHTPPAGGISYESQQELAAFGACDLDLMHASGITCAEDVLAVLHPRFQTTLGSYWVQPTHRRLGVIPLSGNELAAAILRANGAQEDGTQDAAPAAAGEAEAAQQGQPVPGGTWVENAGPAPDHGTLEGSFQDCFSQPFETQAHFETQAPSNR